MAKMTLANLKGALAAQPDPMEPDADDQAQAKAPPKGKRVKRKTFGKQGKAVAY